MVKSLLRSLGGGAILLALLAGALLAVLLTHGVSARTPALPLEKAVARALRHLAVPAAERARQNPVPASDAVLEDARAHWADHCASCHANDGSGDTEMGRHLFPPAPDMRQADTQELSDGELYWIIRNGVRFTGMPAWGPVEGDNEQSWALVHFVRRLPDLTGEDLAEMERLNPTLSRRDLEEELEIQRFLAGDE